MNPPPADAGPAPRSDELDLLDAFAAQCAQALERISTRETERVAHAAASGMAEALQRSLLTAPPQPEHLEIAVRYLPATRLAQVGGDWYDAFLLQDGRTGNMIFSVPELVARISAVCPMLPGDLIFTGTPSGVGMGRKPPEFLRPGATLVSTIEGVGELRNALVAGPGFPQPGR